MIYELSVFHVYVVSQTITQKPERRTVYQKLILSQSVRHNIRTRKLTSSLLLTQSVGLQTSVYNLSVSDTLNLSQVVGRNPIELSVYDLLFHWQTVQQPKWEQVTQALSLGQTIVGHACTAVRQTLTLTQSVVGNVVRDRTVSQNLNWINGVSAWLSDPNFNYLNPVFTVIPQVRFRFDNLDIYLRKPEFDDTYRYEFTRINRRSRGGDLLISRDSMWPAVKTFSINFTYLTQAEIDVLLNFMKLSLGKRCRYLNYDNVEWEGFITNPQTEARQIGRSNRTITIEFDGEPL